MSNLNSWIQEELYPSLFEVIPGAFPEFEFKRTGKGWQSTNKTKVTGEEGDSKGKVYIYENAPWRLKDYTRDYKKDLIGYVMDRDHRDDRGSKAPGRESRATGPQRSKL